MAISSELRGIIAGVPDNFADPAADFRAARATFASVGGYPVREDLQARVGNFGGVRSGWYSNAASRDSKRLIFQCHGGAFIACAIDGFQFFAEMIAQRTGCQVFMPDYRLAPENPYPAAHDDCFNAYKGLIESGFAPQQICVMGDSCGGGLGMSLMIRARDAGVPLPACYVSIGGWFDLAVEGPPIKGRDPFLNKAWMKNRVNDYLAGGIDPKDPRISPAYADLSGMPPLYLQVGELDTVREGALLLAANAVRAGVDVRMEGWPEMIHAWQAMVGAGVPEAVRAWELIRAYIDEKIPGP